MGRFKNLTKVQDFKKKGEFGTRSLVTVAGFCSQIKLHLQKLHNILSAETYVNLYTNVQLRHLGPFFINSMSLCIVFIFVVFF